MSGKVEENGRGSDSQVPTEDLERNQKILQWMMEGEALRHKKGAHRCGDTPYTRSLASHTFTRCGLLSRSNYFHFQGQIIVALV